MSATLLMAATGKRQDVPVHPACRVRDRRGLVVDLVVGVWLQGYASGKFWIVWPICTLIVAAVAFVAAVLQKLIGAAGTLLTIIVIILVGNPSSGGANGVPYLPTFWRDIGPYLPPRTATSCCTRRSTSAATEPHRHWSSCSPISPSPRPSSSCLTIAALKPG